MRSFIATSKLQIHPKSDPATAKPLHLYFINRFELQNPGHTKVDGFG